MQKKCKSLGCAQQTYSGEDFCQNCFRKHELKELHLSPREEHHEDSLSKKYPKYYKDVGDLREVDVYAVHKLFNIQDPSGAIQHASKKLLLSGVRTGGKSVQKDIQEARDTLDRWLQLNPETE